MICMHPRSAVAAIAPIAFVLVLGGCAALQRVPGDGLYAGELCTAAPARGLDCGAADVSLSGGRAKVRVSDLIYDLNMEDGRVEVMLVHGRTLVDVWSAPYSWDHHFLRFIDQERRTFYRVRFAELPARADRDGAHPSQ